MSNKNTAGEQGRHPKRAEKTPSVAARATAAIEANPLLLVAGGAALGAVAGALLPRSEQERALMAPVGERIGTAVGAAIDAGRDAGKAQLDELGINRDAARGQVKSLFDGLVQAASTAGSAAAQAAASASKGGGG